MSYAGECSSFMSYACVRYTYRRTQYNWVMGIGGRGVGHLGPPKKHYFGTINSEVSLFILPPILPAAPNCATPSILFSFSLFSVKVLTSLFFPTKTRNQQKPFSLSSFIFSLYRISSSFPPRSYIVAVPLPPSLGGRPVVCPQCPSSGLGRRRRRRSPQVGPLRSWLWRLRYVLPIVQGTRPLISCWHI